MGLIKIDWSKNRGKKICFIGFLISILGVLVVMLNPDGLWFWGRLIFVVGFAIGFIAFWFMVIEDTKKFLYWLKKPSYPRKHIKTILISFVLTMIFLIGGWLFTLNDPSYKYSIQFINSNKLIKENLGVIKKIHYSPTSKLSYYWIHGVSHATARYQFEILGNKAKGTLLLDMIGNAGVWELEKAELELSNKGLINLIPEGSALQL